MTLRSSAASSRLKQPPLSIQYADFAAPGRRARLDGELSWRRSCAYWASAAGAAHRSCWSCPLDKPQATAVPRRLSQAMFTPERCLTGSSASAFARLTAIQSGVTTMFMLAAWRPGR